MIKGTEDTKMKYYLKRVFNMNISYDGNASNTYNKIYQLIETFDDVSRICFLIELFYRHGRTI